MPNVLSEPSANRARSWRLSYYLLSVAWIDCAALGMRRIRAGFLTNYGADLAFPTWLYSVFRDMLGPGTILTRLVGSSPERAAVVIFVAGVATELSQLYWPNGFFAGQFDPYDIVAYAVGIGVCYLFDKAYPAKCSVFTS